MSQALADAVAWHDAECWGYRADLPVWRDLAQRAGGPVLDLGCGSGRVALDLAGRGHAVVGVDRDEDLLAELRERAAGLPVEAVRADVRELRLGRRFPLAVAPMQTVQLLGGATGRGAFLGCLREHLEPGATAALAVAAALEPFDDRTGPLPLPDVRERDGTVYSSQPVAIREEPEAVALERRRELVRADGHRVETRDVVRLDRLEPDRLVAEARAVGLEPVGVRSIPPTADHVGSEVVVLRAA